MAATAHTQLSPEPNLDTEQRTGMFGHPPTIRPDHNRTFLRILIFGFRVQTYSRLAINWVRA
jgi:hypothetical protein